MHHLPEAGRPQFSHAPGAGRKPPGADIFARTSTTKRRLPTCRSGPSRRNRPQRSPSAITLRVERSSSCPSAACNARMPPMTSPLSSASSKATRTAICTACGTSRANRRALILGLVLVRWFSWMTGFATTDLAGIDLFDDEEAWRDAANATQGSSHSRGRPRYSPDAALCRSQARSQQAKAPQGSADDLHTKPLHSHCTSHDIDNDPR